MEEMSILNLKKLRLIFLNYSRVYQVTEYREQSTDEEVYLIVITFMIFLSEYAILSSTLVSAL